MEVKSVSVSAALYGGTASAVNDRRGFVVGEQRILQGQVKAWQVGRGGWCIGGSRSRRRNECGGGSLCAPQPVCAEQSACRGVTPGGTDRTRVLICPLWICQRTCRPACRRAEGSVQHRDVRRRGRGTSSEQVDGAGNEARSQAASASAVAGWWHGALRHGPVSAGRGFYLAEAEPFIWFSLPQGTRGADRRAGPGTPAAALDSECRRGDPVALADGDQPRGCDYQYRSISGPGQGIFR